MGLSRLDVEKHLIEHQILKKHLQLLLGDVFVPYKNAIADVNLGDHTFNAKNIYTTDKEISLAGANITTIGYTILIGDDAGLTANAAYNSVFIGRNAGYQATNAFGSVFLGELAGRGATNSNGANFIGESAGQNATNAQNSFFVGDSAGFAATNASYSICLGVSAGGSATNAKNSIFIGNGAGLSDSVDNTVTGTSIAIGNYSGTGGFKDSVSIGHGVINSAVTEMNLGNVLKLSPIYNSDTPSSTFIIGATANFGSNAILTTGTIDGGAITGTSLTIGSNTGANGINFSGPWTGSSALNLYVSDTDTGDIMLYSANFLHLDAGSNIYVDNEITYNYDATFNENINMSLTHGIYWPEETPETYGQPYIKVDTDSMEIYGGYSLNLTSNENININSACYFNSSTYFSDEITTSSNVTGRMIISSFSSEADWDNNEVKLTTLGQLDGLLIVAERTTHKTAIYRVDYHTLTLISGDASWTTTKDNAGTYNLYWETDQFKAQNKVGDNKMFSMGVFCPN